jgi:hypothetical protein
MGLHLKWALLCTYKSGKPSKEFPRAFGRHFTSMNILLRKRRDIMPTMPTL